MDELRLRSTCFEAVDEDIKIEKFKASLDELSYELRNSSGVYFCQVSRCSRRGVASRGCTSPAFFFACDVRHRTSISDTEHRCPIYISNIDVRYRTSMSDRTSMSEIEHQCPISNIDDIDVRYRISVSDIEHRCPTSNIAVRHRTSMCDIEHRCPISNIDVR